MISEIRADVAILMPKMNNDERFRVRYRGLSDELSRLAIDHCFVESHASFEPEEHAFTAPFDATKTQIAESVQPTLVRDLTMSLDDKPLYADESIAVVHAPATNRFIADKSTIFQALPELHPATLLINDTDVEMALDIIPGNRIIVKPITGMQSEGVQVLNKAAGISLAPGSYLAQEYIYTSGGMPEHDIQGMHNLRVLSVAGKAIGGIARVGSSNPDFLKDDYYGSFIDPEAFSPSLQSIVSRVHGVLATKPGRGNNVIAIDTMHGLNANAEERDFLCEVNRRPLRISRWDLDDPKNLDKPAIIEMATRWDKAEAAMLAGLVE